MKGFREFASSSSESAVGTETINHIGLNEKRERNSSLRKLIHTDILLSKRFLGIVVRT